MSTILENLRFAFRSMRKAPGFFFVAIFTLALAIGANTAIFGIVNAILFRPFPYPDPEQLVVLRSINPKLDIDNSPLSLLDQSDIREQSQTLQEIGMVRTLSFNLAGIDEPVRVKGATATPALFKLLQAKPLLGGTFSTAGNPLAAEKSVLLSSRLWERLFDSDPQIVGKPLRLDGDVYTVVGVIPPSSQFPDTDQAELFVPQALDPAREVRSNRNYLALARLKPGISAEQAQADLNVISQRLAERHPETNSGWGVQVLPLREFRTRRFAALSFILLGVVGLVLTIACVNVANLLLQRSAVRMREVALRCAVGAGRARILWQLLTESVVLGLAGGVVGLVLAVWGLKLLVSTIPIQLPSYMNEFALDGRALAFTVLVSLLTAILFGLIPALQLSRPNLTESLSQAGARGGGSRSQTGRKTLVVVQVALSLILLIAAGLMLKSFRKLQDIDSGFDPRNVMTFQINMPESKYPDEGTRKELLSQAVGRLASLPGVVAVGTSTDLPIGEAQRAMFTVDGQSEEQRKGNPVTSFRLVSGDFFGASRVLVRKGRPLQPNDFSGVPQAVVINEHFANRFWKGQDPLNRRIRLGSPEKYPWLTIVGVAGNLNGPETEDEERLEVYIPYPLIADTAFTENDILVRTAGAPAAAAPGIRSAMKSVDPDIPLANLRPLEEVLEESLWLQRISSSVFVVFAVVALALAAIGMYSSIAYSVSQRTREIGIRMALGARSEDVLKMVLRQGLVLLAIAVPLGLAGAFGLSRFLRRLLYEVRVSDPMTFLAVTLFITAVALVAIYIPARRAATVAPVISLKHD